jgi:hypothetical protein
MIVGCMNRRRMGERARGSNDACVCVGMCVGMCTVCVCGVCVCARARVRACEGPRVQQRVHRPRHLPPNHSRRPLRRHRRGAAMIPHHVGEGCAGAAAHDGPSQPGPAVRPVVEELPARRVPGRRARVDGPAGRRGGWGRRGWGRGAEGGLRGGNWLDEGALPTSPPLPLSSPPSLTHTQT